MVPSEDSTDSQNVGLNQALHALRLATAQAIETKEPSGEKAGESNEGSPGRGNPSKRPAVSSTSSQAGLDAFVAALEILVKVLRNIVEHGSNENGKFLKLKATNTALKEKLLRFSAAEAVLGELGFRKVTGTLDEVTFEMPENVDIVTVKASLGTVEETLEPLHATKRAKLASGKARASTSTSTSAPTISPGPSSAMQHSEAEPPLPANMSETTHQPVESSTTIYCDACDKARILSIEEQSNFVVNTEDDFFCSNLPRLSEKGGCQVPDDEIAVVCGEGFAIVLDKLGITTRRKLAASDPKEFDAGPYAAYLELWVERAQALELAEIMDEILADAPEYTKEHLQLLGIASPSDINDHKAGQIVSLYASRLGGDQVGITVPTVEQVETWQSLARAKLEELKWLRHWSALHNLGGEMSSGSVATGANTTGGPAAKSSSSSSSSSSSHAPTM